MKKLNLKSGILSLVIVAGAAMISNVASAQEEEEEAPSIDQELRIMSRVLSESLAEEIGGPRAMFAGASPFDSKVRGSYIPTVGAIFTVQVNFPIRKTEEEEAVGESSEDENEDRWEHFSQRSQRPRSFTARGGLSAGGQRDSIIIELDERREEGRRPGTTEAYFGAAGVYSDALGMYALAKFVGPQYDAQRVEQLRRRIIETLAKYGHRMTSVENSDRILVVVEAPAASSGGRSYRRRVEVIGDAKRVITLQTPELESRPDRPPRPPRPPRSEFRQRGGLSNAQQILYTFNEGRRPGPRDRMLLTVDKSNLRGAMTYGDLVDDVQEVKY